MTIAGKWAAVLKSPMGPMNVELDITESGGRIEGTASQKKGQTMEIENGRIEGNAFSWEFELAGLMKMTLEVSGAVDGDALNAMVKVGSRGSFPLTGVRMAG